MCCHWFLAQPLGRVPAIWELEKAVNVFASLSVSVHLSFILIVLLCLEVFPGTSVFPQPRVSKYSSCDFLWFQWLLWDCNPLIPRVLLVASVSKASWPLSKLWKNTGRNNTQKGNRAASSMEMENKHRHSAGQSVWLLQAGSRFVPHFCSHPPIWTCAGCKQGCCQHRDVIVSLPLVTLSVVQKVAGRTDSGACLLYGVQRD